MECNYAQKEINLSNLTEKLRCVNSKCSSHLEIVDVDVCSGCKLNRGPRKTGKCSTCHDTYDETANNAKQEVLNELASNRLKYKIPEGSVPVMPSIPAQLMNYQNALRKWQKAGRPVRSPEDIKDILDICKGCDWYDAESSRCKGCGCRVVEGGMTIFNKIKLATETCPQEKW